MGENFFHLCLLFESCTWLGSVFDFVPLFCQLLALSIFNLFISTPISFYHNQTFLSYETCILPPLSWLGTHKKLYQNPLVCGEEGGCWDYTLKGALLTWDLGMIPCVSKCMVHHITYSLIREQDKNMNPLNHYQLWYILTGQTGFNTITILLYEGVMGFIIYWDMTNIANVDCQREKINNVYLQTWF